jgi:hypothetical protein
MYKSEIEKYMFLKDDNYIIFNFERNLYEVYANKKSENLIEKKNYVEI